MPLTPGTILGPYEIVASLGAGGMGEVYTARDTRLDRTVAIKVLSEHVASDPDLKQRFEREAKTISSLNHPHICTLYDVGEHQGISYLVMEHLEGVSLAERLEQGPVPLEQALQVAIELADALAAAHRQGIIHRDLKPGNVMLTKAGAKLLDFGLAKLKGADPAAEGLTALVTEDAPLTEQGTILGTFQYMAPEQLEGQDADTRTDIFAFGALVYELVTGKRAFEGKSRASLIAAILERQPPPISSLQTMSPAALDRIVTTCLAKDPDARWQSAGDVGRQLRWIAEAGASADGPAAAPAPARTTGERMVWALAGAGVAAVVVGLSVWSMVRPEPALQTRLTVSWSRGVELFEESPHGIQLTPDGRTVVFIGCEGTCDTVGQRQVFRRPLDQLDADPIAGTEGATWVSVSPDGLAIAFGTLQGVSMTPLSGGAAVGLYEGTTFGGDLGPNGLAVVAGLPGEGLSLISSPGADPQPLTTAAPTEFHVLPQFLPGGRAVAFTRRVGTGTKREIVAVSVDTGEMRTLFEGLGARYSPSGHLLFKEGGSLFAVPFDTDTLEVTGAPRPVLEGLRPAGNALFRFASFDVSANGSVVYERGGAGVTETERRLVWVNRRGEQEAVPAPVRRYGGLDLSPDGTRVALSLADGAGRTVWTYDFERGTSERVTRDVAFAPVWSPDGGRLAFRTERQGGAVVWSAADGLGQLDVLLAGGLRLPQAFAPDGTILLLTSFSAETREDVGMVRVDGDQTYEALLDDDFTEWEASVSPDGRWLAYASNPSGRNEIYVRPFPDVDSGRTLVSVDGGRTPRWRGDGRELFFAGPEGMMVVPVDPGATFTIGPPEVLFETTGYTEFAGGTPIFDVAPDGQRFLMLEPVTSADGVAASSEIVLIQHWFDELRRLVPTP